MITVDVNILEIGIEQGIEQGMQKGEDRLAELLQFLKNAGRNEDADRAIFPGKKSGDGGREMDDGGSFQCAG